MIAAGIVLMCCYMLLMAVMELPLYGSRDVPAHNAVSARYISMGLTESGATNIVSDIIVDYRAYDTLMETTVLFTAILAVLVTLRQR